MSSIRRGNEARCRCKYLGPLAAPWLITQRQKQGWSEEETRGEGGREGGRGAQRLDRKTQAQSWLVHDEKTRLTAAMWKQSFIVRQTASSREVEQQREHKPPNALHYSLFYPPLFFFSCCGCPIIQPAVLLQHFLGGHSFFSAFCLVNP